MKSQISFLFTLLILPVIQAGTPPPDPVRILTSAPLHFEPAPKPGKFVARGYRSYVEFERNQAAFIAGRSRVDLQFAGASNSAKLECVDPLRSQTSTYIGNDRSKWRTGIPNYARLQMRGLYAGIDLLYYGTAGELEYDLVVKPGADPGHIRLQFAGATPRLDESGNLVAGFVQKRPDAYQLASNGARIPVESRYRKNADGSFGFVLGKYDRGRQLVIDPVLVLSAYIYGSGKDAASSIGHDAQGFIYVAGSTSSGDLAVTPDALQSTNNGLSNVFVAKIDPTQPAGSQVVYLTYFGGSGTDAAADMVVTPNGSVYVVGTSTSIDLPTANPAQLNAAGGLDAFVFWLIPSQAGVNGLFYASYLGGSGDDAGYGIAVSPAGIIYITGGTQSQDLPVVNGYQTIPTGSDDVFVMAIDPSKSLSNTLIYSTYFGGSGSDIGRGISVAPDGTAWVAGSTFSPDFPVVGYSYQGGYQPGGDAFLAQFNPSVGGGNSLLYVTFLGGSAQDAARRVVADLSGRIVVSGYTLSTDFPVTPTALQPTYGGQTDAFVAVLNPAATGSSQNQLLYATYFGGSRGESVYDMKEDASGLIYITGTTLSPNMLVTPNALQGTYDLTQDLFILKLDPTQSGTNGLLYSSYVGSKGTQTAFGIDVDANANVYLAGETTSSMFDVWGGITKPTKAGHTNAFVMGVPTCSYALSFQSEQFPQAGGMDNIAVTASPGCNWSASSALGWVTLTPAAGSGSGSVQITIAPNTTGAPMSGSVNIAGIPFMVGQSQ